MPNSLYQSKKKMPIVNNGAKNETLTRASARARARAMKNQKNKRENEH